MCLSYHKYKNLFKSFTRKHKRKLHLFGKGSSLETLHLFGKGSSLGLHVNTFTANNYLDKDQKRERVFVEEIH